MADDSSKEHWSNVAAAWEKNSPRVAAAGGAAAEAWLLERAELRPGQEVLEIACGTGGTGIAAFERIQPGGRILFSDFAEAMVEGARRGAAQEGVEDGAEFAVLDAQDLGLPDESFDVVICGFGLMLMPDPVKAASEARRVLRPGGRLVLAVWAEEDANPWLGVAFRSVMEELGAPPPAEGTPTPFALGSAEKLEAILREAGFAEAEVERVELVEPHDSFDSWWSTVETSAGPVVAILKALDEDTRGAIRERAAHAARSYESASRSLEFPSAFNGAVGR